MPDAPAWLREAFRDGVDERALGQSRFRPLSPAYRGAFGECWLAQHDPALRPCTGRLERFHFIGRQRVRNALAALLPGDLTEVGFDVLVRDELILLAEWDPRNGGIACEGHHRRFDNHATSDLVVPLIAVPNRTIEFAYDWRIEAQLEKFPT